MTGLGAVKGATDMLADQIKRLAGVILGGVPPDQIELAEGFARIKGTPEAALPFMACGAIINMNNAGLPPELDDVTLNCRYVYRPPFEVPDKERKFGNLTLTYATQIHACVIEIDKETGTYEIVDYAAVDDCGKRIHPQIVEGQVHGATAHGLGAAMHETFPYDEDGTLLTANFYDYHVPHALDMPPMKTGYIESPSPFSSLGTKGMGEGGGAGIHAVCAAVQDALRQDGGAIVTDSHNPYHRVWELLQNPEASRAGVTGRAPSMKVEGTKHFDAPQAKVWEVLNDPSRMAKTMPGVKDFSIEDDRHWTAKVVIPLGLGGLKMSINFEKVEERAPDYARLNAKGTGVGAMLNMDTQFELSESGGGTEMKWEADVRLMGQVGSMGQRVLQPIVNQQVQNVLGALDEQIREAGLDPGSGERIGEAAGSGGAE